MHKTERSLGKAPLMINESKQFESHEAILPNGVLPFEFLSKSDTFWRQKFVMPSGVHQWWPPMMTISAAQILNSRSADKITWWEKLADKLHHINGKTFGLTNHQLTGKTSLNSPIHPIKWMDGSFHLRIHLFLNSDELHSLAFSSINFSAPARF